MEHSDSLSQLALVLAMAFAGESVLRRLHQPAMLGYIFAGILLGPSVLGVVHNEEQITFLAELGILLLLFILGLEMDLRNFARIYKVAIGTALPELTINIQAIKKNHSDLAVGNVLGCSIINTLIAGGVLSLSGATVPSAFSPDTTMGLINIGAFMGSAGLLTATLMATKGALTRWQGGIALAAYTAYLASALVLNEGKELPVHQHGEARQIEFVEPVRAPMKNLG